MLTDNQLKGLSFFTAAFRSVGHLVGATWISFVLYLLHLDKQSNNSSGAILSPEFIVLYFVSGFVLDMIGAPSDVFHIWATKFA